MGREKSQSEILEDISLKLDAVLSFLATRELENNQGDVVRKLYEIGLSAQVIARIAGLSENAVNIRLTRLRKKAAVQTPARGATHKAKASDKSSLEEGAPR